MTNALNLIVPVSSEQSIILHHERLVDLHSKLRYDNDKHSVMIVYDSTESHPHWGGIFDDVMNTIYAWHDGH